MTRIFVKWMGTLPLLILLALGICKKPIFEKSLDDVPPLVLATSLEDSLPSVTIKALNLESIDGIKIQYNTGLYASYFEYRADPETVIKTISQLPFPIHTTLADTICRPVGFDAINLIRTQISSIERETMENFWTIDPTSFVAYECIKAPFKHILQISKNSNQIFHRIEFIG